MMQILCLKMTVTIKKSSFRDTLSPPHLLPPSFPFLQRKTSHPPSYFSLIKKEKSIYSSFSLPYKKISSLSFSFSFKKKSFYLSFNPLIKIEAFLPFPLPFPLKENHYTLVIPSPLPHKKRSLTNFLSIFLIKN